MIGLNELRALLSALPSPVSADSDYFSASQVGSTSQLWIGKSAAAPASFLIDISGDSGSIPAIDLPSLRVRPRCQAVIDSNGTQLHADVCVIECRVQDTQTCDVFVRCIHATLLVLEEPVTAASISAALDELLSLFRDYSVATEAEILGLWAELFFINQSPDPAALVASWRLRSTSRFDFMNGAQRIDVKATTRPFRRHHLSWEQANPPAGAKTVFVSIRTEAVVAGLSVASLWGSVSDSVPQHRTDIDRVCIQTLGRDWTTAMGLQFDEQAARDSLELYMAEDVPRITQLPNGVTGCRFESDFDSAQEWDGDGAVDLFKLATTCRNLCRR
ncbi:MAG: PD-(D/E)XK motif protein [Phycisphaerales bacterium JB040]